MQTAVWAVAGAIVAYGAGRVFHKALGWRVSPFCRVPGCWNLDSDRGYCVACFFEAAGRPEFVLPPAPKRATALGPTSVAAKNAAAKNVAAKNVAVKSVKKDLPTVEQLTEELKMNPTSVVSLDEMGFFARSFPEDCRLMGTLRSEASMRFEWELPNNKFVVAYTHNGKTVELFR